MFVAYAVVSGNIYTVPERPSYGSSFYIQCEIEDMVTWKFNDSDLPKNAIIEGFENTQLHINDATQDNTGMYSCMTTIKDNVQWRQDIMVFVYSK